MLTRGTTLGFAITGGAVALVVLVMVLITALTPPPSASWPGAITQITSQLRYAGDSYSPPPRTVQDPDALRQATRVLERNEWKPGWTADTVGCGTGTTVFVLTFDDKSTEELRLPETCGFDANDFSNELSSVLDAAPQVAEVGVPEIRDVTVTLSGKDEWTSTLTPGDDPERVEQLRDTMEEYDWNREWTPSEITPEGCSGKPDAQTASLSIAFADSTNAFVFLPAMCAASPKQGSLEAALHALVVEWAAADKK